MYYSGTIGAGEVQLPQAQMDRTGIAVPRPVRQPAMILGTFAQILLLLRPGNGGGIGIVLVGHSRWLSCGPDRPYRSDAPTPWYNHTNGAEGCVAMLPEWADFRDQISNLAYI
jgi:hypothetical protein